MVKTLRAWRAERLLSTRRLAQLAGASNKTIVQIELGRQLASFATISKLSRALAVEPREVTEFARALDARGSGGPPPPVDRAAAATAPVRVFCVSGSAAFLTLARRLLEAERYAVAAVIGAPVTLAQIATFQPDVLLLDLDAGPPVGPQFIEQLRRRAGTRRIPVVVTARDPALLARVATRPADPDGAAIVAAPFDDDLSALAGAVDALAEHARRSRRPPD